MNEVSQKSIKTVLASETLNMALLNSLPFPAAIIRKDRTLLAANTIAKELGAKIGTHCWDTLGGRASISDKDKAYLESHPAESKQKISCVFCECDSALNTEQKVEMEPTI